MRTHASQTKLKKNKSELIKLVLGLKVAIKYIMTINAPVSQSCPFGLALPVKEESEGRRLWHP